MTKFDIFCQSSQLEFLRFFYLDYLAVLNDQRNRSELYTLYIGKQPF